MKIDVDRIMDAIVSELHGRAGAAERPGVLPSDVQPWWGVVPHLPRKSAYELGELLAFSDRAFVAQAYRAILLREPEEAALLRSLDALRGGRLTKVELLASLRWSPEGLQRGVHVDGLLVPTKLQRLKRRRFVGPVVAWFHGWIRIARLASRLDTLEARTAHEAAEIAAHVGRVVDADATRSRAHVDSVAASFDRALENLRELIDRHHQSVEVRLRGLIERQARVHEHLAQVADAVHDLEERTEQASRDRECMSERAGRLEVAVRAVAETLEAASAQFLGRLSEEASQREIIAGRIDGLEASVRAAAEALEANSQALHGEVAEATVQRGVISERVDRLEFSIRAAAEGLEITSEALHAQVAEATCQRGLISERIDRLEFAVEAAAEGLQDTTSQNRAVVDELTTRLQRLDPAPPPDADALYVALEDAFRGSPELIRARVAPYLAEVREANVGSVRTPILDLGSGGATWLALLRDEGFHARGVDSNALFVDLAMKEGLEVAHGDALEYLAGAAPDSLGAVTAMHVVEHLPFNVLLSILDEAMRVLVPGGLLILETPNPENVLVGAHYFYADPTHRNPIPPATLAWLVEARGFKRVPVRRLTEGREWGAPARVDDSIAGHDTINAIVAPFAIAPDYAVIARKL
jgi:SAM-dependent methyltransferase